jgi:hypothetical protein
MYSHDSMCRYEINFDMLPYDRWLDINAYLTFDDLVPLCAANQNIRYQVHALATLRGELPKKASSFIDWIRHFKKCYTLNIERFGKNLTEWDSNEWFSNGWVFR